MSELTETELNWLAKEIPDLPYAEPGDGACPACEAHVTNLRAVIERIIVARLASAEVRAENAEQIARLAEDSEKGWRREADALAEDVAEARREGAAEVEARVEATVDDWQRELDSGAIRDADARYCWMLAAREVRAALRGGA